MSIRRYMSVAGNAGIALSSMYAAVLFATSSKTIEYGFFAFFLLLQSFACGIVNSLVNTPHFDSSKSKVTKFRNHCNSAFFFLCLLLSVFLGLVISVSIYLIGSSLIESILAGSSAFIYCIRWHLRSVFNTENKQHHCYYSDFLFSTLFFILVTIYYLKGDISLFRVLFCTFIASIASFLYCLYFFIGDIRFVNLGLGFFLIKKYFFRIGFLALSGVVATEILSNFFSYLITYKFGPELFSLVALSMMCYRPVMIISSSIIQSERAQLRSLLCDNIKYNYQLSRISKLLFFAFFINFFTAIVVVTIAELHNVFGDFDYETLMHYTIIFSVVFASRCITSIFSLDFQARGSFEVISKITMLMAIISILFMLAFSAFEDVLIILVLLAAIEVVTSVFFYLARKRFPLCIS